MSSANTDSHTPETTSSPPPPKSLWERILNAIPVVMTVLATLLAGLSSSEMTQAQYYRSLAAQYQSKVGDQWNFFQAKRQRGSLLSGQVDILRSQSAGAAGVDVLACAEELARTLRACARQADLVAAAGPVRTEAAAQADHAEGVFLKELAPVAPHGSAEGTKGDLLADPRPALREELHGIHADLPGILDAIEARRPETDITGPLGNLRPEHLSQAIERVETRAAELDDATRDSVRRFERVDELVTRQLERLRPFHAAARALDEQPGAGEEGALAVRRATGRVADTAAELIRAAQLARNEYNERRYECEARYNQVIAGLYETQVRKNGLTADKHRRRSYLFFYAMLAAQGGVTLATFALAVRQMSALWGLASFVGLAAMIGGIYVYLFI